MRLKPPANVLARTPIYRMVHIDCLPTILARDALHAPSCLPNDGLPWVGIHAPGVQATRGINPIPCGPAGVIRDYIGFYLGPRSPMLNRIRTGHNVAHVEQEKIIYLATTAQDIAASGLGFAFSDRHSLARVAAWRDNLADLNIVDFAIAYATYWNNTLAEPDRQEKKQAEFLVHQTMPWNLIQFIGVYDQAAETEVQAVLAAHPARQQPPVGVRPLWYY